MPAVTIRHGAAVPLGRRVPVATHPRPVLVALLSACALLIAGCGSAAPASTSVSTPSSSSAPAAAPPAATTYPLILTDDVGRRVTIAKRPQRIASLTLGTDEVLLEMLGPSRVVGVTKLATDPASSFVTAAAKGLTLFASANAEQVVALHPDVVFAADYTKAGVVAQIAAAGIPVVQFTTFSSIADVEAHIRTIATITGDPQAGDSMIAHMESTVASVKKATSGIAQPRVVYYSDGYLEGKGTTADELITAAGGIDAAAAAGIDNWVQVGPEEIASINPDIILTDGSGPGDIDQGAAVQAILTNPAYKDVRAVKDKAVWGLSVRAGSDVSQYMTADLQDIGSILHPGAVAPYSP